MRVEEDQRVVPHSVTSEILKWDEKQIIASVRWQFVDEDQYCNLVMQANKATRELIIHDATPHAAKLSANIPVY